MSVSRRSFFSAVAGAIAGAVASKALAAPSAPIVAPPMAGKSTNVVEFCRRYLTKEKIEPWQEDILLQAANCTVKPKIPDCPYDWSSYVYRKFATECATQVDRECWLSVGIDTKSFRAALDSLPKYNDVFMTINDVRALEGLRPIPADDTERLFGYPVHVTPGHGLEGCWRLSSIPMMTLPIGWEMVRFRT